MRARTAALCQYFAASSSLWLLVCGLDMSNLSSRVRTATRCARVAVELEVVVGDAVRRRVGVLGLGRVDALQPVQGELGGAVLVAVVPALVVAVVVALVVRAVVGEPDRHDGADDGGEGAGHQDR